MIYERVNFCDNAVKGMKRDDFIQRHKDAFWTDKDEETRVKMLGEVYDRINPSKKKTTTKKK